MLDGWKDLKPFKAWCVQVLPTIFDESMSYYECLCKMVKLLNDTMNNVDLLNDAYENFTETTNADIQEFKNSVNNTVQQLQNFVNNYFDNLDVQEEIDNKLNDLVTDGTFTSIISSLIKTPSIKVVNSIEEMTDKLTLYVLSTDGHLYQYDGSDFIDTGLSFINAEGEYTQKILKDSTSAENFDANNFIEVGVYTFLGIKGTINNVPSGFENNCEIYVLGSCASGKAGMQIARSSGAEIYYRIHYASYFLGWRKIFIPNNVYEQKISATNTDTTVYNADDFREPGIYTFLGIQGTITNVPLGFEKNCEIYVLGNCNNMQAGIQIARSSGSELYYRIHFASYYLGWRKFLIPNNTYEQKITALRETTEDYDANNFIEPGIYTFLGIQGSIANVPVGFEKNCEIYVMGNCGTNNAGMQIARSSGAELYYRIHFGTYFLGWRKFLIPNNTYEQKITAKKEDTLNYDANTFVEPGIYTFMGIQGTIANVPEGFEKNCELYVMGNCASGLAGMQIARSTGADVYYRIHFNTYFLGWRKFMWEEPKQLLFAYKGIKDFVAIGDSLTQSLSYQNETTYKVVPSWALIMGRDIDKTPLVIANGGWTVENYLSSGKENAEQDTSQMALIFLGTNDARLNTPADDFKTRYKEAVEGLLTNHKCVICISLIPSLSFSNYETYNNVIKEICAETNKAFYCDMIKYSPNLIPYKNYGHLSSLGYSVLAHYIEMELDKVFTDSFFQFNLDFNS